MASRKLIYSPCSKENFDISCKDSINRADGINKQNNIVIRTSLETQKTPKTLKTQNISDSAVSNYKYRYLFTLNTLILFPNII